MDPEWNGMDPVVGAFHPSFPAFVAPVNFWRIGCAWMCLVKNIITKEDIPPSKEWVAAWAKEGQEGASQLGCSTWWAPLLRVAEGLLFPAETPNPSGC